MSSTRETDTASLPCPAWIWSSGSNAHVAKDRSWFGDGYVPFQSFITDIMGNETKVVGIGSVVLPVKRSLETYGPKSHGKLVLKNVLHVPTSTCNILGDLSWEGYNVGSRIPQTDSRCITDMNDRVVACFKPIRQSPRFELRLSGPPIGPRLGPSPFTAGAHYMLHVNWPEGERTRFAVFQAAPPAANPKNAEKAFIDSEDDEEDEDENEFNPEAHFADHVFDEKELTWIESNWGNSNNFMLSYGLKFYKNEDCDEAKAIARALMHNDDENVDEDEDDDESGVETDLADHIFDKEELAWIKSNWGNSSTFLVTYGLKFYNDDDWDEAKAIVRACMHDDENGTDDGDDDQDDDVYEAAMTVLRSRMANNSVPPKDLAEAQAIMRTHMAT
ncbi:hypothetical protein G7Z17_g7710 [Cylindrodendrum hubeiense]|uniref:Retrovirus-related Pol polyprotein from transposon TNT 1-94-like beta-barrel domain-containing protein n=1 Tax=Cylindrodendrum hubeiense TaxID=595255 RepID=A0A9P5LFH4_9HYPO|nr:hypothetical protein G7Z17_g7710 [Cylindrodendrum hubeiense]